MYKCVKNSSVNTPYYTEVEMKCAILDHTKLISLLNQEKFTHQGIKLYHDHYFTKAQSQHAETSGHELRLRLDTTSDKLYLTEKKPLPNEMTKESNAALGQSKLERESCIGTSKDLTKTIASFEEKGFSLYTHFYKKVKTYHTQMGDIKIEIALAQAKKTLTEINDTFEFVELEIIDKGDNDRRTLEDQYRILEQIKNEFKDSISEATDHTYTGALREV